MANAIYPKWKETALQGSSNLSTANVKVLLIDTNGGTPYTYSAAHQFLSDVPAGARVASSGNLATKTFTNGTFSSGNPVFTAATGITGEAIALYEDTGTAGTSRLIAFYDTGVTGLPVTPNGGDINVTVSGSGWFTL
jgi:hypothetical protein